MAARAVVQREGYRDLLLGQAVSAFGDWMGTVALMALVLDLTGSATAVGGILVLRLLPAGFAGPVAAGVAERWDRRRIMLACDLLRAGLVAVIPFVRAAWWVFLWAFVLEGASLVFLPARDASIPDLVDEEDLPTANGLILASSYGNLPLGAGAFALLSLVRAGQGGFLAEHPNALAFWVDALTFLVSFLLIRRLTVLGPAGRKPARGPQEERADGLRDALRLPVVRAVLPPAGVATLGIGALFSLGVVFVRQVLHASAGEFGALVALFGLGGVLGWAGLQRYSHGSPTLATVKVAIAAMGAVLAGMSLVSNVGLAYVAAVPFGAAGASALVGSVTYLQETLAGERRVLGLAAFHAVLRIGMSVAAIGGALLAQTLEPVRLPWADRVQPPALVLFGAGLAMVAGAALLPARVPQREREADR